MIKMGFVRGAVLGLLAGLLVAPRSGKETRDNFKKLYEEITERICEELGRLKVITRETYTEVVGAVVRGFEEARKITSDEASKIKDELKKGFEEVKASHERDQKAASTGA